MSSKYFCESGGEILKKILGVYGKRQEDLDDYINQLKQWLASQYHLPETPGIYNLINYCRLINCCTRRRYNYLEFVNFK